MTIVKNLKMCSTILATSHDINVLTHKIKACAIHFCIKMLETSYSRYGKNNW